MSQSAGLSQFPDLPPEVVRAVSALQFELSVERAARLHEQAVGAEKDAFITELTALVEKLEGQVGRYRHARFGPKSEKLDPAQLELAPEDLETAIAETQAQIAAVEDKIAASATVPDKAAPHAPRKTRARPEHLPRTLRVIEPDSIVWSPLERQWSERQWRRGCGDAVAATRLRRRGCGDMVRIGAAEEGEETVRRTVSPTMGRSAGLHPGALSGHRHDPPQVCLPTLAEPQAVPEGRPVFSLTVFGMPMA